MARPPLARDVVRYAGDIVAVVLTETREEGIDAAEHVLVDYDPLPPVVDPEDSLRGEVLLFPDVGNNVCAHVPPAGDDGIFEGCEVVVHGRVVSQRMAPAPLEPRSTAAWFEDGRLHAWLSTQTPHNDRDGLAAALGLDAADVRVVAPDVGGGFGAKGLSAEDVIVAWLARETGRPVRWTESRSENMLAIGHARAQRMDFTIGGSRDGKVQAYKLDVLHDAGAYPGIGAFLPHADPLDAGRGLRDPGDGVRVELRGHEHRADDRLPRRRPARGGAGDRARDRCLRHGDRPRPRGRAPEELRAVGRVPVRDHDRSHLRLRRLRALARPGARGCGIRRAARRAGPAARGR